MIEDASKENCAKTTKSHEQSLVNLRSGSPGDLRRDLSRTFVLFLQGPAHPATLLGPAALSEFHGAEMSPFAQREACD